MDCPYCLSANAEGALVCAACSRDIVPPATLIAERDDLLRKRDLLRSQLDQARQQLELIVSNRRRSG